MVKRDKNAHQTNNYKMTHHTSGKSNRKSGGKGGKGNKSINKFLGIGQPGPHLMRYRNQQAAKKFSHAQLEPQHRSNSSYDEDSSSGYRDRKVNNKKAKKRNRATGTEQQNQPQQRGSPHHSSLSGESSQWHQHRRNPLAHAGTYAGDDYYDDEYERAMQDDGLYDQDAVNDQQQEASSNKAGRFTPVPAAPPIIDVPSHSSQKAGRPTRPTLMELYDDPVEALARRSAALDDVLERQQEKIRNMIANLNPKHLAGGRKSESIAVSESNKVYKTDRAEKTSSSKETPTSADEFQHGSSFIRFNNDDSRSSRRVKDPVDVMNRTPMQEEYDTDFTAPSNSPNIAQHLSTEYPWIRQNYSLMSTVPRMLTQEVTEFVNYLLPTKHEHEVRFLAFKRIKNALLTIWPEAEIQMFGSYETGLYLPTSDLDIVVIPKGNVLVKGRDLFVASKILRRLQVGTKFEIISKAKIPLIKLRESYSNISIDISFNQRNGVQGAEVVRDMVSNTPGLKQLVILVKYFLMLRGLNDPSQGGLGSYATTVMILSFLQRHPAIESGMIDPGENLGVLLIEFFELYGRCFNYKNVGLTVAGYGSYFDKAKWQTQQDLLLQQKQQQDQQSQNLKRKRTPISQPQVAQSSKNSHLLVAIDPIDPSNNVARAAREIERIRSAFDLAFVTLTTNVKNRDQALAGSGLLTRTESSLIKSVLWVPQEVIEQRERLEGMFRDRYLYHEEQYSRRR
ncbi:hypothetical protein BGZ98_007058 [Dissophora globulifera]|nr:hypothetical protein BGZ98_007058 [Dissophora globulifera]